MSSSAEVATARPDTQGPVGAGLSRARKLAAVVGDYARITREAFAYEALRTPEILGKTLDARLRYNLGPVDFFLYDLMNRPRSTWREYLREHPHNDKMLRILHPFDVEFVVRDKVLASERFVAHGVPIAPITAVVGRRSGPPCNGDFPMLGDVEAVMAAMPAWPDRLFVKPVSGSYGEDTMALQRDGEGWIESGRRLSARELAERLLGSGDPTGVLVQPRIANDSRMAGISCGVGLCATRVVTALTVDGPEVFVAAHKVLGSDAVADNFRKGMSGNLVCPVDIRTGRLGVAYGRRAGGRFLLDRYTHHPATRQRLEGFKLPHWEAVIDLAKKASLAFLELPFLGHDIAITGDGPLMLETNSHWRITFPQLARGGLRTAFRELIPRLATSEEKKAAALAALD